jgi:HlyD family secretion protein
LKIDRRSLIVGVSVVLIAAIVVALVNRRPKTEYITAAVERGAIHDAVEATGAVNAVTTVQVGSQVSGTISRLDADFNTRVHRGEIIALIDPALFRGSLRQAVADSENAYANMLASEANLAKAKAALAQTQADYDRTVRLAKDDLVAQAQLEISKANNDGAVAGVGGAEANVQQARAQLSQKTAAVAVARTNLGYTVIRSPIDGVVVARNVDVGQTVAASLQAPTIFTIAQDLAKMQVYAKVDESDIGRIHVGRAVTFKVDAFPKQEFTGTVSQIRMNPTVVQNVVTYDAVIDFANPDMRLFPGMTAYVTIPVASVEDALRIPNAALHYRPSLAPKEIRALYKRYGIRDEAEAGSGDARARQEHDSNAKPLATRSESSRKPAESDPIASAIVWKRTSGGETEPVQVELGITDHAFTAATRVVVGELKEGDALVTRMIQSKSSAPTTGQGARR